MPPLPPNLIPNLMPNLGKVLGGARGKAKELEEALWNRYGGEGDDGFQYSQSIKSFVSNLPR